MEPLKILISAYACEPHKGSEPGVGWNISLEMSKYFRVWVLTRTNNREAILEALAIHPNKNIHFVFFDVPKFILRFKKGEIGVQVYYYIWQIGAYFVAKKTHKSVGFDLFHHVTFVKYWTPTLISLLPIPFLWGPVGGGESTPKSFLGQLSPYGRMYEYMRSIAKWIGEKDPLVRLTAKRSSLSIATTKETAKRLAAIGSKRIEILTQCGIGETELEFFKIRRTSPQNQIIFISIGNLLHLKGFHLSIRAFHFANLQNSQYWLVGDGPERQRLHSLARDLKMEHRICFWGRLPHADTLAKLSTCDVLVHPSLHESGGGVCLEAMTAGIPIICLDEGGPGSLINSNVGIKIPMSHPNQVVEDMKKAIIHLAGNPLLRQRLGQNARDLVKHHYTWEQKGKVLREYYYQLANRKLLTKIRAK